VTLLCWTHSICCANRSATWKPHWGFHALQAPPHFSSLLVSKENIPRLPPPTPQRC